jgi:hypothetical protein
MRLIERVCWSVKLYSNATSQINYPFAISFLPLSCALTKGQLNDEFLHISATKHTEAVMAEETVVYEKQPQRENKKVLSRGQKPEETTQWKHSHFYVSPASVVSFFSAARNLWTSRCGLRLLEGVSPALPMQLCRHFVKVINSFDRGRNPVLGQITS